MALTPAEWASIWSPIVSALGIIASIVYTPIKTRVKPAKLLVFDVYIKKLYNQVKDGKREHLCVFQFIVLNTGDKVGFLTKYAGDFWVKHNKKTYRFTKHQQKEKLEVPINAGAHVTRTLTLKTDTESNLNELSWFTTSLSLTFEYYTHKGKLKSSEFGFAGSSKINEVWED